MTGIDDLLQKTSRTFALTIPQLPPPTREEVGLAYLLFRIVDTFEDATRWAPDRRMAAIRDFLPLLEEPDPAQARRFAERCGSDAPVDHAGYLELLAEIPFVLSCLHALPEPSREIVREHVRRSAEGMIEVVARSGADRVLRLGSIPELRDYCYVVAGIVGEMLTELFLLNHPRAGARPRLPPRALAAVRRGAAAGQHPQGRRGRRARGAHLPPAGAAGGRDGAGARGSAGRHRIHAGAAAAWRRRRAGRLQRAAGAAGDRTLAAIEERRPGNKLSRLEVLTIIARWSSRSIRVNPRYRPTAWTRISRPQSEPAPGAGGAARRRLPGGDGQPAAAKTRFFPLPMYTTVPNEGSTYGAMPVFMVADDNDPDKVQSITAPSVSWNSSAGVTGTYRYYRYLELFRSWHLLLSASTTINRSVWFTYDDDRRTPGTLTLNILVRVRRNLFYRYSGRPQHDARGESSYTRLFAIGSARVGWNLTSDLNLGAYGEVRGDSPERHAIEGLPATQDVYPDAPGLGGAALVRAGLNVRYDTRAQGDYSPVGFAAELSGDVGHGITGVGWIRPVHGTARVLVPEFSSCRGRRGSTGCRSSANDVPFYDQASLGGEVLFRGFPENRFIDMGAWQVEAEQRFKLFQTHFFGVVADWRIDPFVAAGQVYGQTRALGARARLGRRRACGCSSTPTSSAASTWPTPARVCGRTSFSGIRTSRTRISLRRRRGAIN